MADRICRRCRLSILDSEELLTCGEEFEHFCTADCIERLWAENERLRKRVVELEASDAADTPASDV